MNGRAALLAVVTRWAAFFPPLLVLSDATRTACSVTERQWVAASPAGPTKG
ncbi:hypothetical protein [Streptomyces sp. NK08204]|uniref:hypothetical protein n=1 Tax=Streptomyces sp. NK08204 TaxID=2873260 RepID=UPI001CED9A9E|nr:hypothetical protein [Streptomyces sp. NK08204]